jgi:hypothetical protein
MSPKRVAAPLDLSIRASRPSAGYWQMGWLVARDRRRWVFLSNGRLAGLPRSSAFNNGRPGRARVFVRSRRAD